jgi:hypothetical protein
MPAMSRRRLIRWSLILVVLAAFVVWLEPTRVVWGWLREEAFYQGRPTSYWRAELEHWQIHEVHGIGTGGAIVTEKELFREPKGFSAWFDSRVLRREPHIRGWSFQEVDGAEAVFGELQQEPAIQQQAGFILQRLAQKKPD